MVRACSASLSKDGGAGGCGENANDCVRGERDPTTSEPSVATTRPPSATTRWASTGPATESPPAACAGSVRARGEGNTTQGTRTTNHKSIVDLRM